jgi:KUP system potassium uptake protein
MEPSIQFAEASLRPTRSNSHSIGGVTSLRSRSKSRGKRGSIDLSKIKEVEDAEDEDAGLRDERDFKRSQVCQILAYRRDTDNM